MTEFYRATTAAEQEQLSAATLRLQEIGVDTDSNAYVEPIVVFLNNNRNIPITADNIVQFVNANSTLFTWRTAVEREYDELAPQFSEFERDFIGGSLKKWGYEVDDEQVFLQNWNIVAKAFLPKKVKVSAPGSPDKFRDSSKLAVTPDNFRLVFNNLLKSPQGHLLQWKIQRKFNAEAAAEEVRNAPKVQRDEDQLTTRPDQQGTHPDGWTRQLSGHLKDYRDKNLRPTTKIEPDRTDDPNLYWRSRADGLINAVRQSNLIREEARQQFDKTVGAWGAQLAFKNLEIWLARRIQEFESSGRMS